MDQLKMARFVNNMIITRCINELKKGQTKEVTVFACFPGTHIPNPKYMFRFLLVKNLKKLIAQSPKPSVN